MVRKGRSRRLKLEAFWRAHLKTWRDSNLNQREYCALHGLPLKRLDNWRAGFRSEETIAPKRLLYRRGGGDQPRLSSRAFRMQTRRASSKKRRTRASHWPVVAVGAARVTTIPRPSDSWSLHATVVCDDRGSIRRDGSHRLRFVRHAQRHRRPGDPVHENLLHNSFKDHLFHFLGGKANLIKIIYWNGTRPCLFTKRLEHRIFEWPTFGGTDETVSLTSAQLAMLIQRINWRSLDRSWR